jgi:hypothetical protein
MDVFVIMSVLTVLVNAGTGVNTVPTPLMGVEVLTGFTTVGASLLPRFEKTDTLIKITTTKIIKTKNDIVDFDIDSYYSTAIQQYPQISLPIFYCP